jgi:hypothetical protein
MGFYHGLFPTILAVCPNLLPTQAANLALLTGAIMARRTLSLTDLARAYPVAAERQVAAPKHELLHRLKRLSRFLSNERVDPVATQAAFIPYILARLGNPRWLGLTIDWTSWAVALPRLAGGGARKYQVLTIAVPRRGRALPLLSVAYEGDKLPVSQNRCEEEALAAVLAALPAGVRPVVIGDRAFGRAGLIAWLQARRVDYVLRLRRGCLISAPDGRRWKTGEEGLGRGQARWEPGVRYGTYHDRPRDLVINLAASWRPPKRLRGDRKGKEYTEPWYLATSLASLDAAVAWYRQRMWLEETFKDFQSTFGLDEARVGRAARLGRLLAALSLAVAWLHLLALPKTGALPRGWAASVVTCGRASLVSLALAFLDDRREMPPNILPHRLGPRPPKPIPLPKAA